MKTNYEEITTCSINKLADLLNEIFHHGVLAGEAWAGNDEKPYSIEWLLEESIASRKAREAVQSD